ncbi:MAG: hypothetical protein KAJ88_00695 [Candidatus Aenigmarchaeota archaeon]|nr:hypothetical protein [Candidatus Aenigmarchaeota archaeon]
MDFRLRIAVFFVFISLFLPGVYGAGTADACAVYFTGIGCSHCAHADPVVLDTAPKTINLVVIEYEVYRASGNSRIMKDYDDAYGCGFGVPQIIFGDGDLLKGDTPIITGLSDAVIKLSGNGCPLVDGSSVSLDKIDITALPGEPNIWKDEKILIYSGGGGDAESLRTLLLTDDAVSALEDIEYEVIEPLEVPLSGDKVLFDNAVRVQGWIFQWDGEGVDDSGAVINDTVVDDSTGRNKISLYTLSLVALADTINPCALAVFILMLIGITTYDPGNRRGKVIYAGLAFVAAVFIMYFFYGLIIIRSFQLVESITNIRPILYNMLAYVAIILGLLHLKGYFWYKPGGLLTEMPMKWRPRVKEMMTSITSPKGAFFMGAFVTLFLIPCTMGPYFIAGGMLSALELIETIPLLLIYNLIFILPLLGITFIIHFKFKEVDDVSGWKEKNIKKLHLAIGIIMLSIGLGIFMGLI